MVTGPLLSSVSLIRCREVPPMQPDLAHLFCAPSADPAEDRRATQRFLRTWQDAARGSWPSWGEFRAVDFGSDWNRMFVVDVKRSNSFPYFIYLGAMLAALSDIYLRGDDQWTISLLDRATSEIDAVVASGAPHMRESVLTLYTGRKIMFRALLAPLSSDGVRISEIVGVVSGRFER